LPEFTFSRSEIERLAEKLNTLAPQLSGRERELLLAIFSVASERVRLAARQDDHAGTGGEAGLNELRDQLINSFVPAVGDEFLFTLVRIGPES
jgi:hypothetical protein